MPHFRLSLFTLILAVTPVLADGPADNQIEKVRPIPPKGSPVPAAEMDALKAGLAELGKQIDDLRKTLRGPLAALLPDVEIYHKAVRYAVEYDEIYNDKNRDDIKGCKTALKIGMERAAELKAGKASWTTATGLVVRGYKSKIDGSVQPYGLIVPEVYKPNSDYIYRMDLWWHGRGETLTEVDFIRQRSTQMGEFVPRNAFVLHPYGRYCNANKFAGEVDTFEAIEHVKANYSIEDRRIIARGFSMGGAACWQFATHFPTTWAAAAPGAGFAETPEFLNNFQNEKVKPTWYEERLFRLYNATDYAGNLFNCPTVAYSGEDDKQKQAADIMAKELKKLPIELVHIIGPKTGHRYEAAAKEEVNRRVNFLASRLRDPYPAEIKFTTYTLRYNKSGWLNVEGLEKHWEKATVNGALIGTQGCILTTKNISRMSFILPSGTVPPALNTKGNFRIDDTDLSPPAFRSDGSFEMTVVKTSTGKWRKAPNPVEGLAKKPGLQGPIDDAFYDAFRIVKPTGKPMHEATGKWVDAEMAHAITHWRSQFRGDAQVTKDTEIKDSQIAAENLILFGDPSSNAVLAKIADKLPIKWTKDGVVVGDKTYPSATNVPVLIYPNPLNPNKYVVLNSGFTFREYDYLNNARQVPKLPDYAVVDITTPPNSRFPGKIVRAGFFGEKWELQEKDGE
ncbi:MAG: prolyl oligopeptidase family serine peptidase [Gemmataceae bacterium]